MHTTRNQKEARKSRGIEMLSDMENLDIMLGENHFSRNERDESISSNQARRPGSASGDEFENNGENNHLDIGSIGPGTRANYGQNSTGGNSSAEINKLSSELNSRLSRPAPGRNFYCCSGIPGFGRGRGQGRGKLY